MIVSDTITAQQNVYTQQTNSKKSEATSFDEALKFEETSKISEVSNIEKEKKVDRMSFNFIKNIKREEIPEIYADLDQKEISKIYALKGLSDISENNILNKVLFNEAKNMSSEKANLFFFEKASSTMKYKETGVGQTFIMNQNYLMSNKPINNDFSISLNSKLSHENAFNYLIDMIDSSKEGMNKYSGELKGLFSETFNEYTQILNKYNNQLKNDMSGIDVHA